MTFLSGSQEDTLFRLRAERTSQSVSVETACHGNVPFHFVVFDDEFLFEYLDRP